MNFDQRSGEGFRRLAGPSPAQRRRSDWAHLIRFQTSTLVSPWLIDRAWSKSTRNSIYAKKFQKLICTERTLLYLLPNASTNQNAKNYPSKSLFYHQTEFSLTSFST